MASPVVKVRVPEAQQEAWKEVATRDGLTVSGFIKKACDSAAAGEPYLSAEEIDAYHQLSEQLRRAGINLNVLVRDMQAYNLGTRKEPPWSDQFDEVRQDLVEALRLIRRRLGLVV